MADKANRLTDEKLEEKESGCLPFIPERKRPYKKRWPIMQRLYSKWHIAVVF